MNSWAEHIRLDGAAGAGAGEDSGTWAAFDCMQELVWTWAEEGRATSYAAPDYTRYTAYRTTEGALRQLAFDADGVLAVASQGISYHLRTGLPIQTIGLDDSYDLVCALATDKGPHYYIGGNQPNILLYDTNVGQVIKEIPTAAGCVVLRRSGRFICSAASSGVVSIHNPNTLAVETTITAHSGAVADIDISGNLLITSGYSERHGQFTPDPFVKVYDIRTMRPLTPISYPPGAQFVRFHPRFSSAIFMVSQMGSFQLAEVGSAVGSAGFFQLALNGYYCNSFDLSSSGNMIVFGDTAGTAHVWSMSENPQINMYAHYPEPVPAPPEFPPFDIDERTPLNVVGMPYYSESLFSQWPNSHTFRFAEPPHIDEEILGQVKQMGFVGYAPNPGNRHRNQVPKRRPRQNNDMERPRFRSEQERLDAKKKATPPTTLNTPVTSAVSPSVINTPTGDTPKTSVVPKHYRRVEIQYSKLGVEDFDFGFYNRTKFSGLETHIQNSYSNPLLQALYFIPPFRQLMIEHVAQFHAKDVCLACELGYLFRMLDDSDGSNCHSSNFLRAFRMIPQVAALGLYEPEEPTSQTSYAHLIQNLTRFLLQNTQQETTREGTPPLNVHDHAENSLDSVFGIKSTIRDLCVTCKNEIKRDGTAYTLEISRNPNDNGDLEALLASALHKELTTKAWCSTCGQYRLTTQAKTAALLPPVLLVNVLTPSVEMTNKDRPLPFLSIPTSLVVESLPDSNNTSTSSGSKFKLKGDYLPLRGNLSKRFEAEAEDNNNVPLESEPAARSDDSEYILVNLIAQIHNGKDRPHLVTHVRVPPAYHERNKSLPSERFGWYLFNDFLVTPLAEHKVTQMAPWKTPAVLGYIRSDMWKAFATRSEPAPTLDPTFLIDGKPMNGKNSNSLTVPIRPNEIQQLGHHFLCAIDAEFVTTRAEESEVRSDGSRLVVRPSRMMLARVSVVRGGIESDNGPFSATQSLSKTDDLFGQPFIDDYISATEPVVDYLTKFSGVKPGDLDPATATQALWLLKTSYRKLCVLIEQGCRFVGHGLRQDFRIINIRVPRSQVIDTVDLYHLKGQRKISLKFLAWYLLKRDIQVDTHSSVEDSQAALALYHLYRELVRKGHFEAALEEVYEAGRQQNWAVPVRQPHHVLSGAHDS